MVHRLAAELPTMWAGVVPIYGLPLEGQMKVPAAFRKHHGCELARCPQTCPSLLAFATHPGGLDSTHATHLHAMYHTRLHAHAHMLPPGEGWWLLDGGIIQPNKEDVCRVCNSHLVYSPGSGPATRPLGHDDSGAGGAERAGLVLHAAGIGAGRLDGRRSVNRLPPN